MSSTKSPNDTKLSSEFNTSNVTLEDVLLPARQIPRHYDLTFHPFFPKENEFKGYAKILVDITEKTSELHFHSVGLDLQQDKHPVRVRPFIVDSKSQPSTHGWTTVKSMKVDELFQKVVFTLKHDLQPGPYEVEFPEFTGVLNDEMMGFYRSKYEDSEGEKYMASTQFEPCDARRAFPCIDQPQSKATFSVSIICEENLTVLSNMPEIGREVHIHENGKEFAKTIFAQTGKLPTYLVAFVIGDLDYIEDTSSGICIRVYARKGQSHLGKFALKSAVHSLPFFSNFFRVPYPARHLNMVAIPSFSAGAMENEFLFTFRESRLLLDENNVDFSNLKATARTTSHECSHTWFGNRTTGKYWTYLWLQEGFARFCEHLAVDDQFPDWNIFTEYASGVLGTALDLDSLSSAHPVEVPVKFPEEINEIFDAISYAVGSVIIRMIYTWIGRESFRDALHTYLNRFVESNATTEDLWQCMEEASGEPIREAMDGWVKQTGYPLITVYQEKGDTGTILHIKQERFLQNGSTDDSLWKVPIWLKGAKTDKEMIFLNGREGSFEMENLPYNDWVKLNFGQTGFFRVKYSHEMMQHLHKPIREKTLPAEDRLMILSDTFALAVARKIPVDTYMDILSMYNEETEYAVWMEISGQLSELRALLMPHDNLYPAFEKFLHRLTEKLYHRYGFEPKEGESQADAQLRNIAISKQIAAQNDSVKQKALNLFLSGAEIPADLKRTVYSTAVEMGKYDQVKAMYEKADLPFEKQVTLQALCTTKSPERIDQTIDYIFSDKVRSQDLYFPIAGLAYHEVSRDHLWKFMKKNWDMILKHIGKGNFLLAAVFKYATRHFQTQDEARDVADFFKQHYNKSIERTANQAEERIRTHAMFMKEQMLSFEKYFVRQVYSKEDLS
eukprot:CAMPEP_0117450958 /NCGR_PEP_ID=MMETSP0759-20121206/8750_1 /TAXON_ID=63605 /ORGANISM="Percolomonas cosmopolitus, Strain WS" /LENGTH=897 /DNA_ID=CAMNT_0005243523 /DNA_START=30 /DNA_END=2723 /DNA_ORIENTATION=-